MPFPAFIFWMRMKSLGRRRKMEVELPYFIFPLLVAIILSLCYSFTIAPGLTWAHFSTDGGDLITATATGGVPHPSGYPLYLLLARFFQFVPVGPLPFRTNLFSAICTITASLILYAFLVNAMHSRPNSRVTAFLAALTYGTLPLVWGQALVTEVYALHGLLVIVCFYLLDAADSSHFALLCGLAFGLSVTNHLTSLFVLPLLVLGSGEKKLADMSTILKRGVGVILGLLLYIILPLRATSNPPVNWGNPSTLKGFIWLVSGQLYQTYAFSISAMDIFARLRAVAGIFIEQFTFVGVLLVIYGLMSRPPLKILIITVWVFLIFTFFAIIYGSFDSQIYLLPVWMCSVIWLAYGAQDLSESLTIYSRIRIGLVVFLFIGLFVRIIFVFPRVNVSNDSRAEDFVSYAIEQIPHRALVFASSDEQVFSLWYMRFALNQRDDVIIIANGLLQFEWYDENLRNTFPLLNVPAKADKLRSIDLFAANPNREVCYFSKGNRLECR